MLLLLSIFSIAKGPGKTYKSFDEFYDKIAGSTAVNMQKLPMADTATSFEKIDNDHVRQTLRIRLLKWNIQFVVDRNKVYDRWKYDDPAYIMFNDQKINVDSEVAFEGLTISDAAYFTLENDTFILFNSYANNCNGIGCRLGYHQLFSIHEGKLSYQVVVNYQQPEDIYCDLNKDGQLDRVSFAGKCSDKTIDLMGEHQKKNYFCIEALTLKGERWVPLVDTNGKPYCLAVETADFFELDPFKVVEQHWLWKL